MSRFFYMLFYLKLQLGVEIFIVRLDKFNIQFINIAKNEATLRGNHKKLSANYKPLSPAIRRECKRQSSNYCRAGKVFGNVAY